YSCHPVPDYSGWYIGTLRGGLSECSTSTDMIDRLVLPPPGGDYCQQPGSLGAFPARSAGDVRVSHPRLPRASFFMPLKPVT
ncbi:hypothetical protein FHG87_024251, partial [Trinorchestia longiramus]